MAFALADAVNAAVGMVAVWAMAMLVLMVFVFGMVVVRTTYLCTHGGDQLCNRVMVPTKLQTDEKLLQRSG